eukprot:maker-scaffold_25-snap-gene-0.43-mRNA-1 protein AED:0.31 eAED:0.31 QI:87/1/1/1/1/1/3/75/124
MKMFGYRKFSTTVTKSVVDHVLELGSKSNKSILQKNSREKLQQVRRHEYDTGSPEAQVALLNERIKSLENHFKLHRKDKHSRVGFEAARTKMRKQLEYLRRTDRTRFEKLLKELEINESVLKVK